MVLNSVTFLPKNRLENGCIRAIFTKFNVLFGSLKYLPLFALG